MDSHSEIELHFDLISCKALLSCGDKGYVLPDVYPTKEAAQAAAQKFVWEKLGARMKGGARRPSEIAIWLR